MTLRIDSIQSTDLFVGSRDHPLQVLRVSVSGVRHGVSVEISVRGAATGTLTALGDSGPFEVPVECHEPEGAEVAVSVEVVAGDERVSRDADYCFVLAEVDYLKPYWDAYPEDRATIRALLAEGRLELMGGMYNEPSTNLTGAESTIRNAVYGIGFQNDVVGGDPATAISPSPDHWFELGEIQADDDASALWAIRGALVHAEQRRVFALWTSAQIADHVRLMPGFEHPADIHQPDSTHHH
ncbi:hypothetical protein [Nonomuraea sediminis]|uniref:glycoside hydrolase family 38 N-terminal domain-containing protein n=1 Tax=Nonomuraea sediminis TaxID=2835864 RepID=UPI00202A0C80|nr:hypothetical protein [Nonomuraea sediminis]